MRFDDCIASALSQGNLDPDLAAEAQRVYRDRVTRYTEAGQPQSAAEMMANDDVLEGIIAETRAKRHASLRQLETMAEMDVRYQGAHLDPDRILKDVEIAESQRVHIERSFMANIADALQQFSTNVIGQVRNRAALLDVLRELHGQDTGNANAKALAAAIRDTQEKARGMFNALGGDIGKLADYGVRHTHHAQKIAEAGFDAWFAKLYDGKMLDWSRIINHDTGKPFAVKAGANPLRADAERFLKDVFDNITTGGWQDRSPSMALVGKSIAGRRAEHRVLHFKDGDAWLDYNDLFGTQNPFDAVIGDLRGMARDISLMRNFGPNPKMGLNYALQVIEKQAATMAGEPRQVAKARRVNTRKAAKARTMLRLMTGENNVPVSEFWASFFAGTRNLLTAAQLGGAPLSTVTDWVSARLAAKAVGLNPNSHTQAMIRTMAQGVTQQQARELGFIMDTWFNTGASSARLMGDVWSPELTSRITNSVLRLNGLSFLTDRSRVAVQAAFGSDMAAMAGQSFDELPERLRNFMASRRIGPREWDAVRAPEAMHTDPVGGRHINPHWFAEHTTLPREEAEDIAIRWGGLVNDHMEMAIPTASLRGRATLLGDARPGTFLGELGKSGFMYKTFMFSQIFNQMRRIAELDGGPATKAAYVAQYVAYMTVAGALAVQLKEVARGRDPRPMDEQKFWAAALVQGGGTGILGDFFYSNTSRAGGNIQQTLAGPVAGVVGDIGVAVASNIDRAIDPEKEMLIGRDIANLARRYNPLGTFQPLLPVPLRLAMERLIWDKLQLALDPEAPQQFRQSMRKAERDYSTEYWWLKGETGPRRGPNLGNALGAGP